MRKLLIKALTHTAAILVFLAISVLYFSPEYDGKVLVQSDVQQYEGGSQELRDYYHKEGQSSAWTNSMFSGMPSYQLAVWGGSPNFLDYVEAPFRALGNSAGPVFTGMVMAYLLFLFMGINPLLSMLGAIAYSFGSYNIIIIQAGHITKAWAIAYLPLLIAGMMVMFRRKYILGGVLMALGLALQIKSNHLQITYYAAIFCVFLFVALAIELIRQDKAKELLKATGILTLAVTIGILCNSGNTYANYEMSKESTRGQTELATKAGTGKQSSGLDKEYAFSWSYGKAETFSLLVPDIHGGASGGTLDKSSHLYKTLVAQGYSNMTTPKGVQAYTYWGDQPFTSGPVYFGAIICFLFLLGMFVIQSRVKWAILIATLFFFVLSWGRNFDSFNDIMFHYLPMYNKFRTVSMALVIPALSMLIIAMWGLKEIFSGEIAKEKLLKSLYISTGIVGFITFILWLAPGAFTNFISVSDAEWVKQMPEWYYNALLLDRKELLSADALRSFIYIILAATLVAIAIQAKASKSKWAVFIIPLLIVLVLSDLWTVDRRYLNKDSYTDATQHKQAAFKKSVADESILQDKSASYRVLNLTNNPFAEANTSYYHKSIGGYHAAKLRRYQELVENSLQREVQMIQSASQSLLGKEIDKLNKRYEAGEDPNPLMVAKAMQDSIAPLLAQANKLAMLNAKYIIYHPELPAMLNQYALDNAWFVNDYELVNDANAEMKATKETDVSKKAIIDKRFASALDGFTPQPDAMASMQLEQCKPNYLKYTSETQSEQLAILSEIYYAHGWQAYIDGKPVDHIRANWTLRAMRVPAGKHDIEFKFEPTAYNTARMVSTASSGILVFFALGLFIVMTIGYAKEDDNEGNDNNDTLLILLGLGVLGFAGLKASDKLKKGE